MRVAPRREDAATDTTCSGSWSGVLQQRRGPDGEESSAGACSMRSRATKAPGLAMLVHYHPNGPHNHRSRYYPERDAP
jgi:hypothetical protein